MNLNASIFTIKNHQVESRSFCSSIKIFATSRELNKHTFSLFGSDILSINIFLLDDEKITRVSLFFVNNLKLNIFR